MATNESPSKILGILAEFKKEILEEWLKEQMNSITLRRDLLTDSDLRSESSEFLSLFIAATKLGNLSDINGSAWEEVRGFLTTWARSRAVQGFTPSETATFVFSLKQPLFARLQTTPDKGSTTLISELWTITVVLDKLGLFVTESYQKGREEVIKRQQMELLELSTPVIKLWDGILALPLIGTLDSSRTQIMMESLLQAIMDTGSETAIIDITGVPAVDTLVAQNLLKTVASARLMGARCIISGIRPQIAQTMVHLGVAFGDVATKATLSDALAHALKQAGLVVTRKAL